MKPLHLGLLAIAGLGAGWWLAAPPSPEEPVPCLTAEPPRAAAAPAPDFADTGAPLPPPRLAALRAHRDRLQESLAAHQGPNTWWPEQVPAGFDEAGARAFADRFTDALPGAELLELRCEAYPCMVAIEVPLEPDGDSSELNELARELCAAHGEAFGVDDAIVNLGNRPVDAEHTIATGACFPRGILDELTLEDISRRRGAIAQDHFDIEALHESIKDTPAFEEALEEALEEAMEEARQRRLEER